MSRAFDPLELPGLLVLTWSVALGRCRSAIRIETWATRGVFMRRMRMTHAVISCFSFVSSHFFLPVLLPRI